MKHELLSPVGNYECLIEAINNGADAVYLAGKKFGARAFCDNFSYEEIDNAIKIAHLYGVKVYITVNTLIYEHEFDEALKYISFLYSIGADAIIMQDIGLIKASKEMFPDIVIHSSTQMHNHSEDNIAYLEQLGIDRLVFARELSLKKINGINTKMEKEVFIHGALCISYSGQCLFSSCIMKRSANRGECAGMCRLPYSIFDGDKEISTNGKYLLSPKDLCSFQYINELMESNILSFKIEGRMKSPQYVATVTRAYRKLMDNYENNKIKGNVLDDEEINKMKSIYYRGFTGGGLYEEEDVLNILSCNHIGVKIGDVISLDKNKIKIKLLDDLKQGDGIRFKNIDKGIVLNYIYDKNEKLISGGGKGSIIAIDNFINLKEKDEVFLTSPAYKFVNEIKKTIRIKMTFKIDKIGKATLLVYDGKNESVIQSDKVEVAKNRAITKDDIIKNISKTGNTAFSISNIEEDIKVEICGNYFMLISEINNMRRNALIALSELRENENRKNVPFSNDCNIIKTKPSKDDKNTKDYKYEDKISDNIKDEEKIELIILIKKQGQLKAIQDFSKCNNKIKIKVVIDDDKLLTELGNYPNENKQITFIYKIPRNLFKYNFEKDEKYLVTSYASMYKFQNNDEDYFLNVTNSKAFDELAKYCNSLCLSVENDFGNIKSIAITTKQVDKISVYIYGRVELMIIKHCICKNVLFNQNQEKNVFSKQKCDICKSIHNFYLRDRNNCDYPIINKKEEHTSYILNCKITNLIPKLSSLLNMGIRKYRMDLLNEDYQLSFSILKDIADTINSFHKKKD